MTVFTRTWDAAYEAIPADNNQISQGALRIRNLKEDISERTEVDHSWAGDVDDGLHLKVTFVDPLGAKPTQADDQTYLYTKDVSGTAELFFEDESGNEVQLTAGGETLDDALFPATTKCLFYQAAAPAGGLWVIDNTITDFMLRVVNTATGTGGTSGGSDSPIQMTGAQVPQHQHTFTTDSGGAHVHNVTNTTQSGGGAGAARRAVVSIVQSSAQSQADYVNSTNSAHAHSGTSNNNGSNATWDPQYADVIICERQ